MPPENVVVRFAPSPTGYLHIGGARTAIFNWLYARKTGGKFILRIEDTDVERSSDTSIQRILEDLQWLGLDWDGEPYFQSRFAKDHVAAAQQLIESGHAYKCFCTKQELDEKRESARAAKQTYRYDGTCRNMSHEDIAGKEADGIPYTIRLKIPDAAGAVKFTDAVYGNIEKKHADLEDFVLVRSNGQPLYVLSNAVDDIRDGVTHIIRGQDGLANTPKQILIYQALGAQVPVFAHMSLTLDPQKRKISKRRHGEQVAIHFYREKGFLPWAMVNFLVLLGWATTDNREVFSKEELIEAFDLSGISRTNSVFNVSGDDGKFFTDPKALNINAHYLRTLSMEEIAPLVEDHLKKTGLWKESFADNDRQWFVSTIDLLRERFYVITDFTEAGKAFFSNDVDVDKRLVEKHILKHTALETELPKLADRLRGSERFTEKYLEQAIRDTAEASGIKIGVLVNGVRVAVSGQAKGADFLKMLMALGRESVTERLNAAVEFFK